MAQCGVELIEVPKRQQRLRLRIDCRPDTITPKDETTHTVVIITCHYQKALAQHWVERLESRPEPAIVAVQPLSTDFLAIGSLACPTPPQSSGFESNQHCSPLSVTTSARTLHGIKMLLTLLLIHKRLFLNSINQPLYAEDNRLQAPTGDARYQLVC